MSGPSPADLSSSRVHGTAKAGFMTAARFGSYALAAVSIGASLYFGELALDGVLDPYPNSPYNVPAYSFLAMLCTMSASHFSRSSLVLHAQDHAENYLERARETFTNNRLWFEEHLSDLQEAYADGADNGRMDSSTLGKLVTMPDAYRAQLPQKAQYQVLKAQILILANEISKDLPEDKKAEYFNQVGFPEDLRYSYYDQPIEMSDITPLVSLRNSMQADPRSNGVTGVMPENFERNKDKFEDNLKQRLNAITNNLQGSTRDFTRGDLGRLKASFIVYLGVQALTAAAPVIGSAVAVGLAFGLPAFTVFQHFRKSAQIKHPDRSDSFSDAIPQPKENWEKELLAGRAQINKYTNTDPTAIANAPKVDQVKATLKMKATPDKVIAGQEKNSQILAESLSKPSEEADKLRKAMEDGTYDPKNPPNAKENWTQGVFTQDYNITSNVPVQTTINTTDQAKWTVDGQKINIVNKRRPPTAPK